MKILDKLKEIKIKELFGKVKSYFWQGILMSGFFVILELAFHIMQKMEISGRIIYPIGFSVTLGFFLAALFSFFPGKVNIVLSTLAMTVSVIWTCTQTCYSYVFQTYMEVNKIFMGGDVVENFGQEVKDAIVGNIPTIIILVIFVAGVAFVLGYFIKPERKKVPVSLLGILFAVALHFGCYGLLHIEGSGAYSPISMYKQNPGILDNNMQNFGIMTSLRLDLREMLFERPAGANDTPFQNENADILNPGNLPAGNEPGNMDKPDYSDETETDLVNGDSQTGDSEGKTDNAEAEQDTEKDTQPVPVKTKNILDIDFDALLSRESDATIAAIHQYVKAQPGSNTNQYTGIFEGYNLIMICAESFSSYMITEELTPTLYKMSNSGFSFKNFYGTFKSVTTNGEYAFCTGLMPNTVGKTNDLKVNSTFMLSADKYMPYCMGNVFSDMGARTYAYHGNKGSYYKREDTHTNMGYDVLRFWDYAIIDGVKDKSGKLKFTTNKPNSDLELLTQTMPDYLGDLDENGKVKRFHAYYMTYSGHHPYYDVTEADKVKSPMVYRNREIVDNLPVSSRVKGYIAANLELENMLTQLLASLEEAGCLENTVIVVTNDHYPYGLTDKEFKELATFTGKKIAPTYGIYENSFICYNAGMKENIVVDTPCCTVDIIPTLLNLFGVDYDSRLLAGTDILDPNSFHVAMLYNQSFITDKIKYNTANGKITYLVDKESVSQEYVDACISYIKNKFEISLQIVSNDYYKIVFDSF